MKQLKLPFTAPTRHSQTYSKAQVDVWLEMYQEGKSYRQIAAIDGVPYPTVFYYISKVFGVSDGRKTGRKKQHNDPAVGRKNSQLKNYGKDLNWFNELKKQQDGLCSICKQPPKEFSNQFRSRVLNVDHDHTTGRVRALLCGSCNLGLGKFNDDAALLRAAADYIEFHRE